MLVKMTTKELAFWLPRFVAEARKQDGCVYSSNTLYQIVCGIQRHLQENGTNVNFFVDNEFTLLRSVLDNEMKETRGKGVGVKKKEALPITEEQENILWLKGLLGDKTPQILLDTIFWFCGLCFALRSGDEHRRLSRHQITLHKPVGDLAFLEYTEDCSKNNRGGLKDRKVLPKSVKHYQNTTDPHRCFIRLYELYISKCPSHLKTGAFYLTPLSADRWYSKNPLGHNPLSKVVSRLCKAAKFEGFYTNHSLRVTAATSYFIMGLMNRS